MVESTFKSPAENIVRMDINDIVSQKVNPNSHDLQSWQKLQRSIMNTGFVFPVLVGPNDDYDESTKGQERPSLIDNSDGESTNANGLKIGTQVSNDQIAKFYPYRLIDGSHRSQVIRLGTHYFNNGFDFSDDWADGRKIPKNPGDTMLAYIAWRENFTIPVVVLHQTNTEQMSTEILMNAAHGNQSLDGEKELVKRMLKNGKTKEWIVENLGIDVDVVDRTESQTGIKAEYNDLTHTSKAWDSEEDNTYERKLTAYLIRKSTSYIYLYEQEHPDWENKGIGTSIDIAEEIGFDVEQAKKDFENRMDDQD